MNYQQRKHQSEVMKQSWARRKAANAAKALKAEKSALPKELNPKTTAFFINPTTCKTTPVDLSDDVKNIYLMTFYRDGTVNVAEVI